VCAWQVLCVDSQKITLAEDAVNKFCEHMMMPKAINQSSQLIDSPVSATAEGEGNNRSIGRFEAMPNDEHSQFSQACSD
jgi:hypothetical protein